MKIQRSLLSSFVLSASLAQVGCAGTAADSADSGLGGAASGGAWGSGGLGTGGAFGVGGNGTGAGTGGGVGTGGAYGTGGSVGTGGSYGAGGDVGSGGANGTGGAPVDAFVEDQGADCTVATLPAAGAANAKLPDPFKKLDGSVITAKADWRCRRQEIKKQAERYLYGEKPPKPTMVSGTVSDKSITVNISHGGKTSSFSASVSVPAGTGPFPVVVALANSGADVNLIKGEGVAIINYDPYSVGKEGTARNNKQGAFYSIYGNTSTTGLLAAWAWGVSRIIDVIEQSGGSILKADAVGVTGCSRFGKGAFVIGALDQRIALGMPMESGSAGAPIFRGIPGEKAQSLSSAYGEQPWLGDVFNPFINAVTTLPIDTHEVVALYAPRGLLVLDNPHIANLGPQSAHVAALGGAEVYKALGFADAISYHSDTANGTHCSVRSEYAEPTRQALRRFLLKTGTAPGVITANAKATGNLATWRDWTTPTLN